MYPEDISNEKGRLVGDNVIYFCIHNLFSVGFFFALILYRGLLSHELVSMNLFFTLENFMLIAFISFIAGVLGRGLGSLLMFIIFEKAGKKVMRRSQDTNTLRAGVVVLLGTLGLLTLLTRPDYTYFVFGTLIIAYIFISKFDSSAMAFIISTFLSSLCWLLGALYVIQNSFFNESTWATLVLSYLLLKIIIFALTRAIIQSIL